MVLTDNPNHTKRRATTVEIKNCACLLRNIYMEGNKIIGEIETLSNRKGQDIANLIVKDKVNIGFSLRALGATDVLPDGTIKVLTPIKPITYDIVSNPSHAAARVLDFLPESYDGSFDDTDLMYESVSDSDILFLEQDSININFNKNLFSNYTKDIISTNFINGLKQIKFKL